MRTSPPIVRIRAKAIQRRPSTPPRSSCCATTETTVACSWQRRPCRPSLICIVWFDNMSKHTHTSRKYIYTYMYVTRLVRDASHVNTHSVGRMAVAGAATASITRYCHFTCDDAMLSVCRLCVSARCSAQSRAQHETNAPFVYAGKRTQIYQHI